LLGLAIVLLLAGVGLSLRDILMPKPPPPPRTVLVATTDIDTYTVLRPEMVERREVAAELAPEDAYGELGEKTVLITTRPIKEGEVITRDAAVAVGSSWRPARMDLEILSFPADFDKMVAGQIKPGHKINIYGYHVGEEGEGAPVTLVAHNVWVVDARTASGGEAWAATPEPAEGGGPLGLRGLAETRAAPASIVTVAVEPEVAWKIIEALGAQKYRAWVTLAGPEPITPTPAPPTPTPPQVAVTPAGPETPTPTPKATPSPEAAPQPTATPTPAVTRPPVIHVVLVNWMLDILSPDPETLKLVPTDEKDYTFDYFERELTMRVRNPREIKLWAERQDQDARATVTIDGQKGRVWFKPGDEGVIKIQLVEGADEATVVLVDGGG